jgi:hypothetical protein
MKSASSGNSWAVIEWAHAVRLFAAFASEYLAFCAGGFAARSPFDWNVNKVIPAR